MTNIQIKLLFFFVFSLGSFSVVCSDVEPTMTATGLSCGIPTTSGSGCQLRQKLFEFKLDGCDKPEYQCLNVCVGTCNSTNFITSKESGKERVCAQCVPRKIYNPGRFILNFVCDGKTTKRSMAYRRIRRCGCRDV